MFSERQSKKPALNLLPCINTGNDEDDDTGGRLDAEAFSVKTHCVIKAAWAFNTNKQSEKVGDWSCTYRQKHAVMSDVCTVIIRNMCTYLRAHSYEWCVCSSMTILRHAPGCWY